MFLWSGQGRGVLVLRDGLRDGSENHFNCREVARTMGVASGKRCVEE